MQLCTARCFFWFSYIVYTRTRSMKARNHHHPPLPPARNATTCCTITIAISAHAQSPKNWFKKHQPTLHGFHINYVCFDVLHVCVLHTVYCILSGDRCSAATRMIFGLHAGGHPITLLHVGMMACTKRGKLNTIEKYRKHFVPHKIESHRAGCLITRKQTQHSIHIMRIIIHHIAKLLTIPYQATLPVAAPESQN